MKGLKLALKICNAPVKVTLDDINSVMQLPEGCKGICFVFKDELSAVKWAGIDTKILSIEKTK